MTWDRFVSKFNPTMIRTLCLALFSVMFALRSLSQPTEYSTGAIYQQLQKLNTAGSVLYVAAHPDDENTQLISYLANGLHLRTGYLSATRGDGGQNLIGTEIGEQLGILRTQELLAARRIDGGEQFFTRAIDFGYSKHPDETFSKWGKQEILSDFVWVIRSFKPDVVVTRFSEEPGVTHGHHTASAVLAMEAFKLAGDPAAFPEQLAFVEPWSPKKIFWNVGLWYYRSTGEKFDDTGHIKVDVGGYNPYLGESYTEISGKSRTMHKSQGFGDAGSRGSEFEYLKQWAGSETGDLFGGLDLTWSRIEGGAATAKQLQLALREYDPTDPTAILPNLIEAKKAVKDVKDEFWKKVKECEIDDAILMVTGTHVRLSTANSYYTPGDSIKVSLEVINRSEAALKLSSIRFSISEDRSIYNLPLSANQVTEFSYDLVIPEDLGYSTPYWVKEASLTEGRYLVNDPLKIGLPENAPWLSGYLVLKLEDQFINLDVPVQNPTTDRVKGEVTQPLTLGPEVLLLVDPKPLVFSTANPKFFEVKVRAGAAKQSGVLKLAVPQGWSYTPAEQSFTLKEAGEEQVVRFSITPSSEPSSGQVGAWAVSGDKTFDAGINQIRYDHILEQISFSKTEVSAIRLDLKTMGTRIGYIMGSGDEVPGCLEQVGYQVDQLTQDQVSAENLAKYDAVIVGIRAFNTLDWLTLKNVELFRYAEKGGTVIVQYNTFGTLTNELAPKSLKLSRERVTVEDSEVSLLLPEHPVLNRPNKISNSDFTNWVQERGLYFPGEWDSSFEAVLGMADPGEPRRDGSLLVLRHGKGYYVYTGISFFRLLPAGVPGAYRLMANMIALGKNPK